MQRLFSRLGRLKCLGNYASSYERCRPTQIPSEVYASNQIPASSQFLQVPAEYAEIVLAMRD